MHDHVVFVRVYPQVSALREGPLEAEAARTRHRAVGSDAMHHPIGPLLQPSTIIYLRIRWLNVHALVEEEHAHHTAFVLAYIALTTCNVLVNELLVRPVGGAPLVGVARLSHELAGMGVNAHDAVNVLLG